MSSHRPVLQSLKPQALFVAVCMVLGSIAAGAQALAPSTAVPVVFTRTLKAGQAKPGEAVAARTTQAVLLANGKALPAGTVLLGHVVASRSFVFDPTPYAAQKPSILSIRFDAVADGKAELPAAFLVRAIAGPIASYEAETPHFADEIDNEGTRVLIGGSSFSPWESQVIAPDGDIVGYHRAGGVYARLLAAESAEGGAICQATASEQPVGIFSPDACGVYGMVAVSMASNGAGGDGAVTLASRRQSVELFAGSTALLESVAQ